MKPAPDIYPCTVYAILFTYKDQLDNEFVFVGFLQSVVLYNNIIMFV